MLLSRCLHRGIEGLQGTISPDNICAGFPKGTALSTFGALIPTGIDPDSVSLLTRAFYYHQFRFDRTINDGSKKFSSREDIIKYTNIQIQSDLYSPEQRVSHCREIGVVETVSGIVKLTLTARPGISTAATAWEAASFS